MVGLYLVEPHAKWIAEGKKKLIIKSIKFESHIGEEIYLCGDYCYGIIKLHKPIEVGLEGFEILKPYHKITDEERWKWWNDKQILYAYLFDKIKIFDKPKKYKHEPGIQTFIKEVELAKVDLIVKNLGHEADVANPPTKHPGFKPSCLIYNKTKVLIDITQDFEKQLNAGEVEELNGILITHCHHDAIGGIPEFNKALKYLNKTVELYALSQNINIIKHKYSEKSLSQFELRPFKDYKKFKIGDLEIKPLYVFHDKNFPTTAYNINDEFFYCADMTLKNYYQDYDLDYFKNLKLMIIDGAYWDRQYKNNHIAILKDLNIILSWNNKVIGITGYGNTYPNLEEAQKILDKLFADYKKDNPNNQVKKLMIVKDNQIFNLEELRKEV